MSLPRAGIRSGKRIASAQRAAGRSVGTVRLLPCPAQPLPCRSHGPFRPERTAFRRWAERPTPNEWQPCLLERAADDHGDADDGRRVALQAAAVLRVGYVLAVDAQEAVAQRDDRIRTAGGSVDPAASRFLCMETHSPSSSPSWQEQAQPSAGQSSHWPKSHSLLI